MRKIKGSNRKLNTFIWLTLSLVWTVTESKKSCIFSESNNSSKYKTFKIILSLVPHNWISVTSFYYDI